MAAEKSSVFVQTNPFLQPESETDNGASPRPSIDRPPPPYPQTVTPDTTGHTLGTSKYISSDFTGSSTSTNPFRRGSLPQPSKTPAAIALGSSHIRKVSNGGSPHRGTGTEKFPSLPTHQRRDGSLSKIDDGPFANPNRSRTNSAAGDHQSPHRSPKTRPRRVSSLNERFPGDLSVRPLDMLRNETKAAQRSPHLRKEHIPGADTIDRLDAAALIKYHHEGPYDAALLARNTEAKFSPVAALRETNRQTLKATPRENVLDSIQKHRPLDGVARVPSGSRDEHGRLYEYEEGPDLMREPGAELGRWQGVDYHSDDLKGKGEPAYSIERALKDHNSGPSRDPVPTDGSYIELVERPRHQNGSIDKATPSTKTTEFGSDRYTDEPRDIGERNGESSASASPTATGRAGESYTDWEQGRRSSLGFGGVGGGIKKRIGSLRVRKDKETSSGSGS